MNPHFSGVWKANLEKSKLLGPTPKAFTVIINHSEPELIVDMLVTKTDGSDDRMLFRGITSGEEVTNTVYGAPMRSQLRWVGVELLIESWISLRGREAHFCDYWSLSSDGQTLKMEHRGDDLAGQITLLERMQE
jgi:hypothetical protein